MVLAGVEERARTELAGDAPAFSGPAGLWAARLIYQACCCVVCRELGADVLDKVFAVPCPTAPGPERDWSVDLLFRHLPELFRVARHLSNADPLLAALKALGTAWPLSSVGMPELEAVRIDSFCAHPALRRLYADRIVAAGDFSRIGDPRVADLLRADLGLHRELAPALAARLFPASADPTAAGPTSIGPSSS